MRNTRQYDKEFKVQAIKLAKEIGNTAASKQLNIPKNTLSTWVSKAGLGRANKAIKNQSVEEAINFAEQLQAANKRIRELEKINKELEELNEFLADASAFFAASRRKSGKQND